MKNSMIKYTLSVTLSALLTLIFVDASLAFRVADESAQINCNGGSKFAAPCIIIDQQGHRLGYDPVNKKMLKEFPEGDVGWTGLGGEEYLLNLEAAFNLEDGTYTIETKGEGGLTKFYTSVYIATVEEDRSFDIEGVIDKGMTSRFELTYYSDLSRPWALTRVATPGSLRQDIELSRKIGWIDNDGIVTSLLKKVDAAEKSMEFARTTKAAENQLKALMNEVRAQSGKHIDEKAATILIEDAEYLIDHL